VDGESEDRWDGDDRGEYWDCGALISLMVIRYQGKGSRVKAIRTFRKGRMIMHIVFSSVFSAFSFHFVSFRWVSVTSKNYDTIDR